MCNSSSTRVWARLPVALAAALISLLLVGASWAADEVEPKVTIVAPEPHDLEGPGHPGPLASRLLGGPLKASGPLVAGGDVAEFRVSVDTKWIVYRADQEVDERRELYSVSVDTGTVTKLNAPVIAVGDVVAFFIVPGSNIVVYGGDVEVDNRTELYSVPIAGGTVTKLNAPLVAGGAVTILGPSSDGTRVIYVADQTVDDVFEIHSVPITGGAVTKLNDPLVAGGDVVSYAAPPAGSARVVYLADRVTDGVDELFGVSVAGGVVTKLNPTPVLNGDVISFSVVVGRALYIADQDVDGVNEQYSVPDTGGTAAKLSGAMVTGGNVLLTQNGPTKITYVADQETNDIFELYSVPMTGGVPLKVNGALASGGDVLSAVMGPGEAVSVYRADQDVNDVEELYSVPVSGGGSTKLNGPLTAGGDVTTFSAAGLGRLPHRAHYLADQDVDEVFELFAVPVPGGPPLQINGTLVPNGDVLSFAASNRGFVVYRADQDADEVVELYYGPSNGAVPAIQLNADPVLGGDVIDFTLTNAPRIVVYRADQDSDEVLELYLRALDDDADGDGVSDAVDCFVSDDRVWSIPGEATMLLLSHSGGEGGTTTLSWSAPADPGGTAPAYDVLSSLVPNDFVNATTCVETDDGADTTATDATTPASGLVLYYLVRARNFCGDGVLGLAAGRSCP